ncbi:protein PERCC1 [Leucoraja erinacea]|uniref:protein PERCC1 n=1 Tax=Leucoraja erinaceus TaxID=7782 RepID=UPI0024544098|nr:protein PERCC1 [Leucoraja erinacea]
MAAGVVKSLADFRPAPSFQLSFLNLGLHQDMDFQGTSDEEEEEEEEDEVREAGSTDPGDCPSPTPDTHMAQTTLQLLRFTQIINTDIQRYFGRKSKDDDPDSCNIYEDRFYSGKSGRELYYADLIKVAQDGEQDEEELRATSRPPRDIDTLALKHVCNRESIQQLGPLAELFEYGLHQYMKPTAVRRRDNRRQKVDQKHVHIVPMHRRRLPSSFWEEPISPLPACTLHTSTPDFSDLLANWTSESNGPELQVGREISTEINRQVLESETYQLV